MIRNVSWAAIHHYNDFWKIMWHWKLLKTENSAVHHRNKPCFKIILQYYWFTVFWTNNCSLGEHMRLLSKLFKGLVRYFTFKALFWDRFLKFGHFFTDEHNFYEFWSMNGSLQKGKKLKLWTNERTTQRSDFNITATKLPPLFQFLSKHIFPEHLSYKSLRAQLHLRHFWKMIFPGLICLKNKNRPT